MHTHTHAFTHYTHAPTHKHITHTHAIDDPHIKPFNHKLITVAPSNLNFVQLVGDNSSDSCGKFQNIAYMGHKISATHTQFSHTFYINR